MKKTKKGIDAKMSQNNKVNKKSVSIVMVGIAFFALIGAFLPGLYSSDLKDAVVKTKAASSCTVDAKLVNSCRPWFSSTAGGYPQAPGDSGSLDQFKYQAKRMNDSNVLTNNTLDPLITTKIDIPHIYHTPGQRLFSNKAVSIINDRTLFDANTILFVNYKPGSSWSNAASGSVDADIIASAQAVKNLGNRKILLTLWHEPEDDIISTAGVPNTAGCNAPKAEATNGTVADYRAMWQHVRQVFDQQGVTNLVWGWNMMGYVANGNGGWACYYKSLWPGNQYIDWVLWDPYTETGNFEASINRFYSWLTNNSDAQHDFMSKVWGIAEHGSNAPQPVPNNYWQSNITGLGNSWANNKFPKIKLYSVFDTGTNGGTGGGLRVGYDINSQIDVSEQTEFNKYARALLAWQDDSGSTNPPPTQNPDLNGDGKVNINDLSILLTKWGTNSQPADINKNGTVNIQDLSILLSHWTG